LRVQATNSPSRFEVTTDGTGVVGHAGAALLRELADRVGLTRALSWRVPGGRCRHPDAAIKRLPAIALLHRMADSSEPQDCEAAFHALWRRAAISSGHERYAAVSHGHSDKGGSVGICP
jgi:hypothetical protein